MAKGRSALLKATRRQSRAVNLTRRPAHEDGNMRGEHPFLSHSGVGRKHCGAHACMHPKRVIRTEDLPRKGSCLRELLRGSTERFRFCPVL